MADDIDLGRLSDLLNSFVEAIKDKMSSDKNFIDNMTKSDKKRADLLQKTIDNISNYKDVLKRSSKDEIDHLLKKVESKTGHSSSLNFEKSIENINKLENAIKNNNTEQLHDSLNHLSDYFEVFNKELEKSKLFESLRDFSDELENLKAKYKAGAITASQYNERLNQLADQAKNSETKEIKQQKLKELLEAKRELGVKNFNSLLSNSGTHIGSAFNTLQKSVTHTAENFIKMDSAVGIGSGIFKAGTDLLEHAANLAGGALKDLGKSIAFGRGALGKFFGGAVSLAGEASAGAAIALLGLTSAAAAAEFSYVEKTTKLWQTLQQSGFHFVESYKDVGNVLNNTGLTLEQFSSGLKESTDALSMLGISMTDSAKTIETMMSKNNKAITKSFLAMGYSSDQITSTVLESMKAFVGPLGIGAQMLSLKVMSARIINYTASLQELSDLTHKSAKEMQAQADQMKEVMLYNLKMAQNPSAKANVDRFMMAMPKELVPLLKSAIGTGGHLQGTEAVALSQVGLLKEFDKFGANFDKMSPEDMQKFIDVVTDKLKNAFNDKSRMKSLAIAGGENANALNSMLNSYVELLALGKGKFKDTITNAKPTTVQGAKNSKDQTTPQTPFGKLETAQQEAMVAVTKSLNNSAESISNSLTDIVKNLTPVMANLTDVFAKKAAGLMSSLDHLSAVILKKNLFSEHNIEKVATIGEWIVGIGAAVGAISGLYSMLSNTISFFKNLIKPSIKLPEEKNLKVPNVTEGVSPTIEKNAEQSVAKIEEAAKDVNPSVAKIEEAAQKAIPATAKIEEAEQNVQKVSKFGKIKDFIKGFNSSSAATLLAVGGAAIMLAKAFDMVSDTAIKMKNNHAQKTFDSLLVKFGEFSLGFGAATAALSIGAKSISAVGPELITGAAIIGASIASLAAVGGAGIGLGLKVISWGLSGISDSLEKIGKNGTAGLIAIKGILSLSTESSLRSLNGLSDKITGFLSSLVSGTSKINLTPFETKMNIFSASMQNISNSINNINNSLISSKIVSNLTGFLSSLVSGTSKINLTPFETKMNIFSSTVDNMSKSIKEFNSMDFKKFEGGATTIEHVSTGSHNILSSYHKLSIAVPEKQKSSYPEKIEDKKEISYNDQETKNKMLNNEDIKGILINHAELLQDIVKSVNDNTRNVTDILTKQNRILNTKLMV